MPPVSEWLLSKQFGYHGLCARLQDRCCFGVTPKSSLAPSHDCVGLYAHVYSGNPRLNDRGEVGVGPFLVGSPAETLSAQTALFIGIREEQPLDLSRVS